MTISERKRYNLVIFALFATGFFLFGLMSLPLTLSIDNGPFEGLPLVLRVILSFFVYGIGGGWLISAPVGGFWLGLRFVRRQSKAFIVLACVFFFITYIVFMYVGMFAAIPFAVYNIVVIKRGKGEELMLKAITNPIAPIYDKNSTILILGTMPSPKSREVGFYYSHPQNRFWKTIAEVLDVEVPTTIEEKKSLLYANGIALWDVLASCKISGADDSSIADVLVNDFTKLFETADIKAVFTTGKKATALFKKHCEEKYNISSIYLPSTSPANCGMSQQELTSAYRIISGFLGCT